MTGKLTASHDDAIVQGLLSHAKNESVAESTADEYSYNRKMTNVVSLLMPKTTTTLPQRPASAQDAGDGATTDEFQSHPGWATLSTPAPPISRAASATMTGQTAIALPNPNTREGAIMRTC